MRLQAPEHRYHALTITLHWVMALAIFWMIGSGVTMEYIELEQSTKFNLYQWHKSSGVLVLLALALRLVLRILTTTPALPESFSASEQRLAKLGHLGLYALMGTMVLSGWVMVSASVYGLPTIVFGWFTWPHIPDLQGNEPIENIAKATHFYGIITLGVLLAAHVGAVIKHHMKDHEPILRRMWFTRKSML